MLYDILQFEMERQQTVYMTNSTNFSEAIMVINSSKFLISTEKLVHYVTCILTDPLKSDQTAMMSGLEYEILEV